MTILFANPPWWETAAHPTKPGFGYLRNGVRAGSRWPMTEPAGYRPDQFRYGRYLPFPFFLGSAAAWVKRALPEANVVLRDSIARGESYETFFNALATIKPDVLIVETGASALAHDLKLLAKIKTEYPPCAIALCGPVTSGAFSDTKGNPSPVSGFLQGEYEKSATTFIRSTPEDRATRQLQPFGLLTPAELAADDFPFPMFDEDVALNYWDACPTGQRVPHLQLLTSRGCPYKCSFCAWPATMTGQDPDGTRPRSIRFHSAAWVESFIRHRMAVAKAAGTPLRSIYVDDDTFNLTDKHALAMAEVLGRVGLPWSAMCRADTCKPETWRAMRAAGCFGVKLGFESGSQRVIDEIINKHLDLGKAAETARWLRSELGMTVHGTFTIGLPGETHDEQMRTREFIDELYTSRAIDTHQLSGTAEIPGTPLATLRAQSDAAKADGKEAAGLKKYPGAHIDGDYTSSPDGNKKLEALR